ncbi:MAG TPA: DNA mismatch repair protein, partial [Minicystis sp.]|nr:DNA mismatch repair protein [Minicystis sp.]
TSALGRLAAFGAAVRASEAYGRLDALLDNEDHLATVDLRVRVGADGELSSFQIVAVRENTENRFHTSAIGRLVARLRMMLRGYRLTGGVVVEHLYEEVFVALEPALTRLFQLLGDLEFYLAALGLEARARAAGLAVCFPEAWDEERGEAELDGLWNPLLFGDRRPVPCDVATNGLRGVAIVTGPNSGGKTRLLQAIGIAQMFAQAGFFVPAARARLRPVEGLFVSLIEDARADQPEGQLGMELLRIRRLFEEIDMGSLVLLDELCSGTNPSEGEEIAQLVLSLLPEMRARAFVTTHLLSFAERLERERPFVGLEFLQVALDDADRPTFAFTKGVAKTSLAKQTAARLGVTREELTTLIAQKRRAAGDADLAPERAVATLPVRDADARRSTAR